LPLSAQRRNVGVMKGRAYLILFALGLILLAFAGWAVQGARWAVTGSRTRRPRLAAAG
jgi:hypothetical protein